MSEPIKCTCGNELCKTSISVEDDGLWLMDKKGESTLMYLDPNGMVDLIRRLQGALRRAARGEG